MLIDQRDLTGKTCIFNTNGNDSKWRCYDGQLCFVIKRKCESEYDIQDVGTIWEIQFVDNQKIDAFADELIEYNHV